jgi:hypothetical protein
MKRVAVLLLIFILLSLSGAVIYKFTLISLAAKSKYPVVSCANIENSFKNRSRDAWKNDAIKEFAVNENYILQGKPTHYVGKMQCYCEHLKADKKNFTEEYSMTIGGNSTKEAICPVFFKD